MVWSGDLKREKTAAVPRRDLLAIQRRAVGLEESITLKYLAMDVPTSDFTDILITAIVRKLVRLVAPAVGVLSLSKRCKT